MIDRVHVPTIVNSCALYEQDQIDIVGCGAETNAVPKFQCHCATGSKKINQESTSSMGKTDGHTDGKKDGAVHDNTLRSEWAMGKNDTLNSIEALILCTELFVLVWCNGALWQSLASTATWNWSYICSHPWAILNMIKQQTFDIFNYGARAESYRKYLKLSWPIYYNL